MGFEGNAYVYHPVCRLVSTPANTNVFFSMKRRPFTRKGGYYYHGNPSFPQTYTRNVGIWRGGGLKKVVYNLHTSFPYQKKLQLGPASFLSGPPLSTLRWRFLCSASVAAFQAFRSPWMFYRSPKKTTTPYTQCPALFQGIRLSLY